MKTKRKDPRLLLSGNNKLYLVPITANSSLSCPQILLHVSYRLAGLNSCFEWYFYSSPILQAGCSSCSLNQTLSCTAHRHTKESQLKLIHKSSTPPTEDTTSQLARITPHQQFSSYYNQHGHPTPPWPPGPVVPTDPLVWAFSDPVTIPCLCQPPAAVTSTLAGTTTPRFLSV